MSGNQQVPDGGSGSRTESRTLADIITGEHEHRIVGYSLLKGIGDGEPIASDRFTVGGHEWVLLFYPDGKRSSSESHVAPGGLGAGNGQMMQNNNNNNLEAVNNVQNLAGQVAEIAGQQVPVVNQQQFAQQQRQRRERDLSYSEYTALFVALIGESKDPQGIVNTSDGKVVRAFHEFMLVDQSGRGHHLTKGRRREDGAVKISCARTDPNARNCHGYRKFVRRTILEDPQEGYLVDDTIIIRYKIDLVVSQGGCLNSRRERDVNQIVVPQPTLGEDLLQLYTSGKNTDITFVLKRRVKEGSEMMEDEVSTQVDLFEEVEVHCHKIVIQARSPVFDAMLSVPMREAENNLICIDDIDPDVFEALMFYLYSEQLPPALLDKNLHVAMAQHLLIAADRFQIVRLRVLCEKRLCESLTVDTVANTLLLAEQNNAGILKRTCFEFVAKHLQTVLRTEGWKEIEAKHGGLVKEALAVVAYQNGEGGGGNVNRQRVRQRDAEEYEEIRRMRPRLRSDAAQ